MEVKYTAHYNWEWVVTKAVQALGGTQIDKVNSKGLPSRTLIDDKNNVNNNGEKVKPLGYALFRCEVVRDGALLGASWASLPDLEFLDAKDALFRYVSASGQMDIMPETVLIPWDVTSVEQLRSYMGHDENPSYYFNSGFFLKAALGSGGNGIYTNLLGETDILEVIRGHAARAQRYEGFLDDLRTRYGDVPSWSLQRRIMPTRASVHGVLRNTQIRSYCVYLRGEMYLYKTFEVRVPIWEEVSASAPATVITEAEEEFVGQGHARPYNHGRVKKDTERFLIEELSELNGSEESIKDTSTRLLLALRAAIEDREKQVRSGAAGESSSSSSSSSSSCVSELAILGIDLVVDRPTETCPFRAFIVEVNNNPAMPSEGKLMSEKYKSHLEEFVGSTVRLGLPGVCPEAKEKFYKIW